MALPTSDDSHTLSGIQQLGIGVPDMDSAWQWYRESFGVDVPVLIDAAEAPDMVDYTGNEVQSRRAVLAINLQGGGGFEVWQYTSRTPQPPNFQVSLGDYGILVGKMKCRSAESARRHLVDLGRSVLSDVVPDLEGVPHFYVLDPFDNIFEIIESDEFFGNTSSKVAGVVGAAIGVSDMEAAVTFYRRVLGYDQILADDTGVFQDLSKLPGGQSKLRRVVLTHSERRAGPFSRLFGPSSIELIQNTEGEGRRVFSDRYWGDLGFIHLCFDVVGMDSLKIQCEHLGHPFVVDSKDSFDMGDAAGRFSYIEDPDGTLIEFVETHRIPIAKKMGIYLDLRKRNRGEPLPNWMLKSLRFARVKR